MGQFVVDTQKANNRIGEINIATNGQSMRIVAYRKSKDIDVEFEDGTIVTNKMYSNFLKGKITNPNSKTKHNESINEFIIYYYLRDFGFIQGKTGTLSQYGLGQKEIDIFNPKTRVGIEYDGALWHKDTSKDIEKDNLCKENNIQLIRIREDGSSILDSSSTCFYTTSQNQFNSSLESVLKDICNLLGLDVDIDFKRDMQDITRAYCNNKSDIAIVGETNIATNGLTMKIISATSTKNIDVLFVETGDIVYHKRYSHFKEGKIACPNVKRECAFNKKYEHLGEINISKIGEEMKIVGYRNNRDIDVLFTRTGVVVEHKEYGNFKKGNIGMFGRNGNKNVA